MSLFTIIDVTDQEKKDILVKTCDNQPFIAQAPLVLVFCADYQTMCIRDRPWMTAEKSKSVER